MFTGILQEKTFFVTLDGKQDGGICVEPHTENGASWVIPTFDLGCFGISNRLVPR
jgi:hypothetical protein